VFVCDAARAARRCCSSVTAAAAAAAADTADAAVYSQFADWKLVIIN